MDSSLRSEWRDEMDFSDCDLQDSTSAFINLNTFEDLAALELKLNQTKPNIHRHSERSEESSF